MLRGSLKGTVEAVQRLLSVSGAQLIRYAVIGVASLSIVGGAVFFLERGMAPPVEQHAATTPATNAKPPATADNDTPPTSVESDQLVSLVGEARRLAMAGKFDE